MLPRREGARGVFSILSVIRDRPKRFFRRVRQRTPSDLLANMKKAPRAGGSLKNDGPQNGEGVGPRHQPLTSGWRLRLVFAAVELAHDIGANRPRRDLVRAAFCLAVRTERSN